MVASLKKHLTNTIEKQDGIVSIMTLMIIVILTAMGIMAINVTTSETKIVRNEQFADMDFYQAEAGINDARVNYNNWMDDTFLSQDETTASKDIDSVATDTAGNPLATLQVRCIERTRTPVFNGGVADRIPAMSHIGPPPPESGSGMKGFQARRYSITATSSSGGGTVVQAGVYKEFSK